VYDPTTLALTLKLVAACPALELPIDIRRLVETVYDPALRAAAIDRAPNAKALHVAEKGTQEKLGVRRTNAQRACIAPATFDPMVAEAYYGDDDDTVQALTRDGESTTLLPVLWDGTEARPLDGGDPFQLKLGTASAWVQARRLLEQTISVPSYPWERIERGARPSGEPSAWEEWEQCAESFLRQVGLGGAVLVPMRPAPGGGSWRGLVVTRQGKQIRIAYGLERGLWFRREDDE